MLKNILNFFFIIRNFPSLFKEITKKYINEYDNWRTGLTAKPEYIKSAYNYIKRLKDITNMCDEKTKCPEEFEFTIKSLIIDELQKFNIDISSTKYNSNIKKISSILYYFKENKKEIKFYKESFCEDFFNKIHEQIKRCDVLLKKQYNEYLQDSFKFLDKFFNQNFEEKKNIKTEDINLLFKSVEPKVKEIFNNYNIDKIFQKYEDKILKYLDEKKDDATVILEKNDKDLKKAFDSISSGLHQIIEDFQNEMDKNIESLVDEIEKLKKEIRETIHKVYELKKEKVSLDIDLDFGNFKSSFLELLYNNLGIVGGIVAGGIGAAISVAIFGLNIIPGIGTAASIIAGIGALIFGAVFMPSKKKKLQNLIIKEMKIVKDGFLKQKTKFIQTLDKLQDKLIDTLKKEIGIIAFHLEEGERKEFEENKNKYFQIKDILLKSENNSN